MKNKLLLFALGFIIVTQTLVAQVPSYVPTNGLVGYWPFNGNANDASGNGNNGTVNGATLTADRYGNSNSAYYFSSSGCNTRIDTQINTSSIQTGLTISIWILRVGDGCLGPRILEFWPENNPNGPGMAQWGWGNGINTLGIGSTTSTGFSCDAPINVGGNNIWYNIVYTNDGTIGKFYKDGILITSVPSNGNPILAGNAAFGRMNHPAFDAFNGKLDDIGIWNRALTQQEITNLYNAALPQTACLPANVPTSGLVGYWPFCGNANDESGNGNNGVVNGATLTTDRFGNSNSAYSFDGGNWIQVQHSNTLNLPKGTISLWFKNNLNALQTILAKNIFGTAEGENYGISIFDNSTIGFYSKYNSNCQPSVGWNFVNTTNNYIDNNFHNMVCVIDDNVIKIYIDGILKNSSNTPNPSADVCPTSPLYFGRDYALNQLYNYKGILDDIGIWNRALTPQEITNLYNANQCITNITVTDTLIINVGQLSFTNPVSWANNITIAPNPASTQININFNNITDLNGGTLKIINALGQQVATTPITTSGTNTTLSLATWGGNGMYFVQIINPQGQIVDIKKIILQ